MPDPRMYRDVIVYKQHFDAQAIGEEAERGRPRAGIFLSWPGIFRSRHVSYCVRAFLAGNGSQ
jgi:hypothetical protein